MANFELLFDVSVRSVLDALHMHIFLKAKGRNLTQRQGNVSFLGTELILKHIVYLMWNDNV